MDMHTGIRSPPMRSKSLWTSECIRTALDRGGESVYGPMPSIQGPIQWPGRKGGCRRTEVSSGLKTAFGSAVPDGDFLQKHSTMQILSCDLIFL